MLKIGVFGAGYLGSIHIQQWKEIEGVQIVGIYDPIREKSEALSHKFGIQAYADADTLINCAQALDIVATTTHHYHIAEKCVLAGKDIFIEKPMTGNLKEAQDLLKLVQEAGIKCQIGHIERYNPAFTCAQPYIDGPRFIEAKRQSPFLMRGTDVSVVLDLMIHDLDIVLHIVNAPIKRISATGAAVFSDKTDIANAYIEFENGAVANLTASRISIEKKRKIQIFQNRNRLSIDFFNKKLKIYQIAHNNDGSKFTQTIPVSGSDPQNAPFIGITVPEVPNINAIREELKDFAYAVIHDVPVSITAYDGYTAIEAAYRIMDKIDLQNFKY